jgi:hypothetical protein
VLSSGFTLAHQFQNASFSSKDGQASSARVLAPRYGRQKPKFWSLKFWYLKSHGVMLGHIED